MALVHAAVIVRDVENADGDVLQVLAAIPAEAAFERAVQVGRAVVLILVNLRGKNIQSDSLIISLDCNNRQAEPTWVRSGGTPFSLEGM